MNKTRVLYIALAIMFVVNLMLIVTLFLSGPRHSSRMGPKNVIIKKLSFDVDQIKEYELLIKQHRSSIHRFQDSIHNSKQNLYALLRGNDLSMADSIENEICNYQKGIEKAHFNHFSELKKLCKDDQLIAFEKLTFELESLFSNRIGPPKKNE